MIVYEALIRTLHTHTYIHTQIYPLYTHKYTYMLTYIHTFSNANNECLIHIYPHP